MAKISTGGNWKKANRIEQNYYSQIHKLFKPLFNITKYLDDARDITDAIEAMMESPTYQRKSEEVARLMATMVFKDGAKNWRAAAKKSSKSSLIYTLLKKEMDGPIKNTLENLIEYNSTLIKTLPRNIADDVTKHVQKRSMEGIRASEIAKEIKKMFPERTKASAKLIARTETSKASTALTQARSEMLGHHWYVWKTSEDARVRSSHAHMDDVICNYKNPPSPETLDGKKTEGNYNAGEIYNCRCYAAPIIDYEDVKWPHKVHYNNKIETMSLSKFKEIEGK